MRPIFLTGLIFICGYMAVMSQSHQVTFTTSSDSIAVDSVLATNLNTGQSIMLPGNMTLFLEQSSSLEYLLHIPSKPGLYPNPFNGKATITYRQVSPGIVIIGVFNHLGQQIYQTQKHLDAGEHSFTLCLSDAGIYFINFSLEKSQSVLKAICTETGNYTVGITHFGKHQNENFKSGYNMPNQPNEYKLAYSSDQVMHFKCFGDKFTTIFTDTIESSINHDVEFFDCTDPDRRTYNVVKIGTQIWMEENLAFLPDVSPSLLGSDTVKHYYVYDYEGNSVEEAKSTDNYKKYGVLYNWCAILDTDVLSEDDSITIQGVCPDGWHLPSNDDFNQLNSVHERWYNNLRSTQDWYEGWNGNNRTGFNAYPGGYRGKAGIETFFHDVHAGAFFWETDLFESELTIWNNYVWIFQLLMFGQIGERPGWSHFSEGLSVRCIKDYKMSK